MTTSIAWNNVLLKPCMFVFSALPVCMPLALSIKSLLQFKHRQKYARFQLEYRDPSMPIDLVTQPSVLYRTVVVVDEQGDAVDCATIRPVKLHVCIHKTLRYLITLSENNSPGIGINTCIHTAGYRRSRTAEGGSPRKGVLQH